MFGKVREEIFGNKPVVTSIITFPDSPNEGVYLTKLEVVKPPKGNHKTLYATVKTNLTGPGDDIKTTERVHLGNFPPNIEAAIASIPNNVPVNITSGDPLKFIVENTKIMPLENSHKDSLAAKYGEGKKNNLAAHISKTAALESLPVLPVDCLKQIISEKGVKFASSPEFFNSADYRPVFDQKGQIIEGISNYRSSNSWNLGVQWQGDDARIVSASGNSRVVRHGDFLSLSCGSSSSSTLNHSKPDDNAGVQVVGRGGYYDETYPGDALPKENYRKDFGTAIMLASDKVQTRGTSEVPVSITFADLNTSNFVAPTPSANGAKSAYGALNPKS